MGSKGPAKRFVALLADKAMRSLNWLSGHTLDDVSRASSGMHADIRARAEGLAERALYARNATEPAELPSSPQAAFRELLGGRGVYQDAAGPVNLAPYRLDLLSMPATAYVAGR